MNPRELPAPSIGVAPDAVGGPRSLPEGAALPLGALHRARRMLLDAYDLLAEIEGHPERPCAWCGRAGLHTPDCVVGKAIAPLTLIVPAYECRASWITTGSKEEP
jgi:hypothetical protein